MLLRVEQGNGEHAGRFLAGDATGFMEDGHQSLSIAFRGSPPCKRHDKRLLVAHPGEIDGPQRFDLVRRPLGSCRCWVNRKVSGRGSSATGNQRSTSRPRARTKFANGEDAA